MDVEVVYCIDTSALIDLKFLYPPDVFKSLWLRMEKLADCGRLVAPREVLKELEQKDDYLRTWARRNSALFRELDAIQMGIVARIMRDFLGLVDHNKQIPDADPFVIALAFARTETRNGDDLFTTHRNVVVTSERLSRPDERPRIPNVCREMGIESIDLVEMFRMENWVFADEETEDIN